MADKNMEQVMEKAQVLIEALPYIQSFNRKIIDVKYGGSAMVDEQLKKQVILDVTLLKLVGFKPNIVHGLSLIHICCMTGWLLNVDLRILLRSRQSRLSLQSSI